MKHSPPSDTRPAITDSVDTEAAEAPSAEGAEADNPSTEPDPNETYEGYPTPRSPAI